MFTSFQNLKLWEQSLEGGNIPQRSSIFSVDKQSHLFFLFEGYTKTFPHCVSSCQPLPQFPGRLGEENPLLSWPFMALDLRGCGKVNSSFHSANIMESWAYDSKQKLCYLLWPQSHHGTSILMVKIYLQLSRESKMKIMREELKGQ